MPLSQITLQRTKSFFSWFILCFWLLLSTTSMTWAAKPKYIIIMISGGMGYNHIDASSLYQYGCTGAQIYEGFEIRQSMTTYGADQDFNPQSASSQFYYICDPNKSMDKTTDSASAATAISTGTKTSLDTIGLDTQGDALRHLLEAALKDCKGIGIVTSTYICDKTPAGFIAHNTSSNNLEQIAQEMILKDQLDVLMGCGHPLYDNNGHLKDMIDTQYVGGDDLWKDIIDDHEVYSMDNNGNRADIPWTFTDNKEDIVAYAQGFTPTNLLYIAKASSTLQQARSSVSDLNNDGVIDNHDILLEEPYQVPLNNKVASLEQMTRAALNVLVKRYHGFVLVINAGAVTWASENHQSARMIEEQIDFNHSVEAVFNWIEKREVWNNAIIIVTSNHETGYLTGPGSGQTEQGPLWNPLVNNGAGQIPGMEWHCHTATNALVPFFAHGNGSYLFYQTIKRDPFWGRYGDNTDIGRFVIEHLLWGACYLQEFRRNEPELPEENNAPILDPIGDQSACIDEVFELIVSASDPDNDNLNFSVNNAPTGADFDSSTGLFTWEPTTSDEGEHPNIEFIVTDNGNPPLSDSEIIKITVFDCGGGE